jgi:hypothetical protein
MHTRFGGDDALRDNATLPKWGFERRRNTEGVKE